MSHQAKLDRARKHLDAVNTTIEDYVKLDPYRATPDDEYREVVGDGVTRCLIRGYLCPALPTEQIGLEVGDCVHNMRSALDHLVFACSGSPLADKRIQFPIFTKKADYTSGLWRLANVPPLVLAEIEKLQPYHRGDEDAAKTHLLAMLATLDNIDKRRRPLVSASVASLRAVHGAGADAEIVIFGRNNATFENGAVIATADVKLLRKGAHVNMYLMTSFGVAFAEEAPLFEIDVVKQLKEIHRYIGEDIFPLFKDFL